jgi:uncharacterized protein (DUF983 family)
MDTTGKQSLRKTTCGLGYKFVDLDVACNTSIIVVVVVVVAVVAVVGMMMRWNPTSST